MQHNIHIILRICNSLNWVSCPVHFAWCRYVPTYLIVSLVCIFICTVLVGTFPCIPCFTSRCSTHVIVIARHLVSILPMHGIPRWANWNWWASELTDWLCLHVNLGSWVKRGCCIAWECLGMDAEYITRFRLDPLTSLHFPTFLPLFFIWVLRWSRWLASKERRYVHDPKTRKPSCIPLDRYINVDRFTYHISTHHLRIASHIIPYHTMP